MSRSLHLTDGGAGQILLAIAGVLTFIPLPLTIIALFAGITVSSLIFVGSTLLLAAAEKVNRDLKGNPVGTFAAVFGLVTATIGLILFGLGFPNITYRTSDYIHYFPTELGTLLTLILYIFMGVFWFLLGSAFILYRELFRAKGWWMAVGIAYVILSILYFVYLPLQMISFMLAYLLLLSGNIVQITAGIMGAAAYFGAEEETRAAT